MIKAKALGLLLFLDVALISQKLTVTADSMP